MSYRSERFNRKMKSLEALCERSDTSKWAVLSDGGVGARALREGRVQHPRLDTKQCIFEAEARLVRVEKEHLIPVLRLIVKNGNDIALSIDQLSASSKSWNAARKKYFAHRKMLLEFFQAR